MQLTEPQVRTLAEKCGIPFFGCYEFPQLLKHFSVHPTDSTDKPFLHIRAMTNGYWLNFTVPWDAETSIPLSDETGLLLNVLLASKGWRGKGFVLGEQGDGHGVFSRHAPSGVALWLIASGPTPTSAVIAALIGE